MNSEIQNEKKQFDNIGLFQQSLQKEIIYGLIKEVLFDYDISPHSIASDVELSVQTAFIKGYLEYQHLSEDENLEFELSVRGGPQPISDWIYSSSFGYFRIMNNASTPESLLKVFREQNSIPEETEVSSSDLYSSLLSSYDTTLADRALWEKGQELGLTFADAEQEAKMKTMLGIEE